VFWTLILFGTWCGIPAGSPFPAWIPSISYVASWLLIVPVLAVAIIFVKTLAGAAHSECRGGPLCFMKWGMLAFLVSGLALHLAACCSVCTPVLEFTWFGQAQVQLQIFGFLAMILFGALYYILPLALGYETKLVRAHIWLYILGVPLFILPLVYAGYEQGSHAYSADAALPGLMISTAGLFLILLGNLVFAYNIFTMFLSWKLSLAKTVFVAVTAPLKGSEVNP
jgi:cytochrome c oxidase cbb3-type subunit 1